MGSGQLVPLAPAVGVPFVFDAELHHEIIEIELAAIAFAARCRPFCLTGRGCHGLKLIGRDDRGSFRR
jgi:hypothetical protein